MQQWYGTFILMHAIVFFNTVPQLPYIFVQYVYDLVDIKIPFLSLPNMVYRLIYYFSIFHCYLFFIKEPPSKMPPDDSQNKEDLLAEASAVSIKSIPNKRRRNSSTRLTHRKNSKNKLIKKKNQT